jgi:hypothetical protein
MRTGVLLPDQGIVEYRPIRTNGMLVGAIVTVWALVFAALLLGRGANETVSLSTVFCYLFAAVFVVLGLIAAYWTYGCSSLRYTLDRNGLVIYWGLVRQVVPLDSIKRLVRGELVTLPGISGINWPGYHVGRAETKDVGETLFYSTHRHLADIAYVVTPNLTYAVSPPDVRQFIYEVEAMQKLGATVTLRQMPRRHRLADQQVWFDRVDQGLAVAAIILCAATFGVVFKAYAGLPPNLAISFPPLDVERVAPKHVLLSLPTTAFAVLIISLIIGFGLRAWERMASYMVLASLVAVQAIFLWGAAVAVH